MGPDPRTFTGPLWPHDKPFPRKVPVVCRMPACREKILGYAANMNEVRELGIRHAPIHTLDRGEYSVGVLDS